MTDEKLTPEQLEKLMLWPEKYIPEGLYCYKIVGEHPTKKCAILIEMCPFWEKGYCHYLKRDDSGVEGSLLGNQCKECGVNDLVFVEEK